MLNTKIDKIIEKRKKLHLEDDFGIQKCWDEITHLLSNNESETIEFLESCSEEQLFWISEVFEDVAHELQSKEYIKCLRKLDKKYPELKLKEDIDIAESYL